MTDAGDREVRSPAYAPIGAAGIPAPEEGASRPRRLLPRREAARAFAVIRVDGRRNAA
jgi:hypothetical protein